MSLIEELSKAASKAVKGSSKKKNSDPMPSKEYTRENNPNKAQGYQWEKSNLKKAKKLIEEGKRWNEEHSKTGWTNPTTGDKFSASHYKKNLELDNKAIDRIKKEITKQAKTSILKKTAMNKKDNTISLRKRDKVDRYLAD